MLQKLREGELQEGKALAELDHLGHTDWVSYGYPPPGVCARARGSPAGSKDHFRLLGGPGPTLGAAHEGTSSRGEAQEGAGAGVQPLAHRVPAHPLRDADAGHPRQELQAPQGHGELLGTAACPRAFCPLVALQPPLCALATEWVFRCAQTDEALTHLAPPDPGGLGQGHSVITAGTWCDKGGDTV